MLSPWTLFTNELMDTAQTHSHTPTRTLRASLNRNQQNKLCIQSISIWTLSTSSPCTTNSLFWFHQQGEEVFQNQTHHANKHTLSPHNRKQSKQNPKVPCILEHFGLVCWTLPPLELILCEEPKKKSGTPIQHHQDNPSELCLWPFSGPSPSSSFPSRVFPSYCLLRLFHLYHLLLPLLNACEASTQSVAKEILYTQNSVKPEASFRILLHSAHFPLPKCNQKKRKLNKIAINHAHPETTKSEREFWACQ